MNLYELRQNVRTNIGEIQAGYWSDSELNNNINKAIDDLNEAIQTVSKKKSLANFIITTDGNSNEYELPSDFKTLLTIKEQNNSINFIYLSMSNKKFQEVMDLGITNSSFSTCYYDIYSKNVNNTFNNYIKFSPKLSSGKIINIEYLSGIPNLYNENSDLGIYNSYKGYIIDKATYYSLLKGPSGNYQEFNQNSEIKLNRILSSIKENEFGTEFVEGYLED